MLYFAYGSNLNLEQMQNRCPDSVPVARVILKGYQLCFNHVADIVKKEGGVVHGAIYTVSQADIENLDIYEGYPQFYTKIQVMVEDDQGNTHEAFAYVMTQKGSREPSEVYYNIIKQGYQDWLLPVQALSDARERSYNCIGEADVPKR
jgi:gamma-glutamylcyclotransferase (GGCT)/AIG2-like uncharacterized protein YtfP